MSETAFDLCGPLPSGVTVLEASAGTGKTFTIAALAARFVAEGASLDSLLLVTFTRMATGELRDRVRERLVSTERELSRVLAGAAPSSGDEVVALLTAGPPDAIGLRRDRLASALAHFDAATIDTTHSFCQGVLDELGTLGDVEPDISFVESVDELVEEVVDDLYVRRFFREGNPPFDRTEAREIVQTAIENPGAEVYPRGAAEGSVPAMRQRLALAARDELERRKRSLALMTYDDLLTRLRGTLAGPSGAAAAARLRARYRVVLIDEFQDTDPIQWEIVQRAFGQGSTTLVLIADPKQAIYAFRGADVYAYLEAVRTATTQATLTINRRSDQRLIDGFDALFGGARLGHPGIVYRRVSAAPCNRQPRLHGAPCPAALRVRVVDRAASPIELTARGFAQTDSVREYIAEDLAADVVALLDSGARIEHRHDDGRTRGEETVAPGHVAVLVQSHRNAATVQGALDAVGVPAVINGAGSVFATRAAGDWLGVLEALERPASPPRARKAALTPLVGWDADRLARAGENDLEVLHQRLYGWARVLRGRGMAALAEAIMLGERVAGRMLAEAGGERRLTDLQHVAQLLHGAASAEGLGVTALAGWLRQRIVAASREGANDDLTRRLESDAEAVQVLTIHRAKGLEFPIAYCPFLWEPGFIPRGNFPVYFHDADREERRAIDVGLQGGEYQSHLAQYKREKRGEDLRVAYVALTRARHQAVVWWAAGWNSGDSPLARLLFAQDGDGNVAWMGKPPPSDVAVFERFTEIGAKAPDAISVQWSRLGAPAAWGGRPRDPGELLVASFDRRLDAQWRRTSYTAITAAAHDPRVGSEPEEGLVIDEPAGPPVAALTPGQDAESSLAAVELPLAPMAAGAAVGTLVHRTLEAVDFAAADLAGELADALRAAGTRAAVELGCDVQTAAAGLAAALETPLGGELGSLRLSDVGRRDRLDELSFELPLAGGDRPAGRLGLAQVAALLRDRLPAGDPVAGYGERLSDPQLTDSLRGYLTGSIDLVLRVGPKRFVIVDYKTNWLAAPGESLSAWHYRPAALAGEMERSHYVLQALLYAVALHRYLRWRLPRYDPEVNLGGIRYLFLRGMVGANTPRDGGRCGVFEWRPPATLVTGLSDLLDRGDTA